MKKYFFAKGVVEIILKEQIHRNEVYIMKQQHIPVNEKFILSIREASEYFNIGINKIRAMTNSEDCPYVLWSGSRRLIKRAAFEAFLNSQYSI